MEGGLYELAIIILLAAGLGIVARILRQPLVLAYLLTGMVIGYFQFFYLTDREAWQIFSDLGIMFLLFLVGLEINFTSIRLVGRDSLIIGIGQVIFTFIIGFFIAKLFGYSLITASYIAIALTFSSTIIIVKLLSEKKDFNSLYGKLSIGLLLVQDVIAILLLIFLTGFEGENSLLISSLAITVVKGVLLFILMLWLGRKVLPRLFDRIATSPELLFLVSLAWVFVIAAITSKIGFSIEIGGFLAGIALANSSEHFQIASRIKSLRDFFILIFFAILGSSVLFSNIQDIGWQIAIFSLFVIVGNPIIVMVLMGLLGYRKRTSFFAGVTIAQISEFSLVLAALGFKLGHVGEKEVALITSVAVLTITISSYLITHADFLFRKLYPLLDIFERKDTKGIEEYDAKSAKSIILIGCRRMGQSIAAQLPKKDVLIVDFDPDVIHRLKECGYDYLFGDIGDQEIMHQANFETAKLIISTSPSFEVNCSLLERVNECRSKQGITLKIIVRANDEEETIIFYKKGADYVLIPHLTSGHYLGKAISRNSSLQFLLNLKNRDKQLMQKEGCWIL